MLKIPKYFLVIIVLFLLLNNKVNCNNRRSASQEDDSTKSKAELEGYISSKSILAKRYENYRIPKAVTKKNWVYHHSPRTGALFIRTKYGKLLHPGELNTVRNFLLFDDFIEDFHIKLPSATPGKKYTLIGYTKGYIARAISNIPAEKLYEGIQGESLGNVFKAIDTAKLGSLLVNDTKYCIEVFEQNPLEDFTDSPINHKEWSTSLYKWSFELLGAAGKTCFIVLPKGETDLEKDFYNEFQLIIHEFQNYSMKKLHQGKQYRPNANI